MRQLNWYLEKIAQEEPISKRAFLQQWQHSGYAVSAVSRYFRFGELDRGAAVIKDRDAFDQLVEKHCHSGSRSSRISSAIGGNSHAVAVDAAVVLSHNLDDPHPVATVCRSEEITLPRPLKREALIVENLQNFLALEETLRFCADHSSLPAADVEVLWGSGNGINHSCTHPLLQGFERTWWLVDPDLGGLTIIANALVYLDASKIEVIVPEDLEQRLQVHGKPMKTKERDAILTLAPKHPLLHPLAGPLVKTQRKLEQETYLINMESAR